MLDKEQNVMRVLELAKDTIEQMVVYDNHGNPYHESDADAVETIKAIDVILKEKNA